MSISITTAAVEKIKYSLSQRGHGIGIHIGVKTTGCSGLSYTLEFSDELDDKNVAVDTQGIKILIEAEDMVYLDGISIDFVKEGLNEGFQFVNPNAKAQCGCGESFTI